MENQARIATPTTDNIEPKRSTATWCTIENFTRQDIFTTVVSGVDPFDFETSPEARFNGLKIPNLSTFTQRLEVNYYASNCPWTLELFFQNEDGKIVTDKYSINQKYAIGEASLGLIWYHRTHNITFSTVRGNTLVVTIKE